MPQWDATPKGEANPLKARSVLIEGCKETSSKFINLHCKNNRMRVELHPQKSVYEKAKENKEIAASFLLPLIEFEFAFHGSVKPVLTQSELNFRQLEVVFNICKNHGWTSSKKIVQLGNKNEFCFKLSNSGFAEIYSMAGPMADENKDKWAKLLCERSGNLEEKRKLTTTQILEILQKSDRIMTTLEICLQARRLPNTVVRHLRKLERAELVQKNKNGWFLTASLPANSPSRSRNP